MKFFTKILAALLFICEISFAQVNVVVNLPPVMPSELNQWRDNPSLVTVLFNNPGAPINSLRIGYKIRDLSKGTNIITTKDGQLPYQVFNTGVNLYPGHSLFSFPNVEINGDFYNTAATTNSLPEGQYEFCLYVLDPANTLITLTGSQCAYFQVIIPQPVSLLQPVNNITYPKIQGVSTYPLFLWTSAYIQGALVNYRLRLVPVFQGQSEYDAINTNQTLLNKDLTNNNYQYTPSDPSFDLYPTATKFAWQIRATNQFGNPVTANDGKSEVFCFAFNNEIQPQPLAVKGTVSGCEENSGKIELEVTGGTAPYTYFWKKDNAPISANTATISNLSNGDYKVTVTDNEGKTAEGTFRVSMNPVKFTVIPYGSTCGNANGKITVTVSGGTPDANKYDYELKRTSPDTDTKTGKVEKGSDKVISDKLKAGTYVLKITDSKGCSTTRNFNISDNVSFTVYTSSTKVFCPEDNTGKIYFRATENLNPKILKFEWKGPNNFSKTVTTNKDSLIGLAPGYYYYTATDTAKSCVKSGTESVSVKDLADVIIEKSVTNATKGKEDGEIYIKLKADPKKIKLFHNDGTDYSESVNKGFDTDPDKNIFTYFATQLKGGKYTMFLYFADNGGCEKKVDFTLASCDENFTLTLDSANYYMKTPEMILNIASVPKGEYYITFYNENGTVKYAATQYYNNKAGDVVKKLKLAGRFGEGSYSVKVSIPGGCFVTAQFNVYKNPRCEAGKWTEISIEPVQQKTQMWCWLTCGQMLFTHFGIEPRKGKEFQCDIISIFYPDCANNCKACVVGANGKDNLIAMIAKYSQVRWDNAAKITTDYVAKALTFAQVKSEIDAKKPIIAGISPSGTTGRKVPEHVAMIIGYTEGKLTGSGNKCFMLKINDPFLYPKGNDPYIKAGGKKLANLQYEIEYDAFVSKFVWQESYYNFKKTEIKK